MTGNGVMQAPDAVGALVPAPVRQACERLREAGHEAYAVGGAVRDALLGRAPGDWDVATSATPDQVMAVFPKNIPTGLQHGTVTVLVGRGAERLPVEVTTYRGEGAYSDGRRPDTVVFGVPLREDLARRDFVINAMAYDPVAHVMVDPFGGQTDLAARVVRAVGDARERFAEDGLRVMRAVRFAAQLDFALDPATEAAIPGALPVLARVSWERIRDELLKICGAAAAGRGLEIARRTGILAQILPELGFTPPGGSREGEDPDAEARWQRALVRVGAAGDVFVRLAALMLEAPGGFVRLNDKGHPLRRLKLSNAEMARVDRLLCRGLLWTRDLGDPELRSELGAVGRANVPDLIALWRAEEPARAGDPATQARIAALCNRTGAVLEAGDALTTADLALTGGDIMRILDIGPGRHVGELLQKLLQNVLADPSLNRADTLTELAKTLHSPAA